VADDLRELEQALQILHRHRPRLGVFAALGNHEYLHEIDATRPIYERSPVPLLVDRGVTLTVGGAELYVAGVDDPFGKGKAAAFFEHAVERCAAHAPPDAFRLLLSHRPQGFVAAAARGFHLTLSGHTHGGQVGLFGVSAFQPLLRGEFLWGAYERGGHRLYTTSGFGHWFPFRLGCPTEAPLIVLSR
jgi:predicted MPP superfamily phosphohydrolase